MSLARAGAVLALSLAACGTVTDQVEPPATAPPPTVAVEPAAPAPSSEPEPAAVEPAPEPDSLVGPLQLTKGAQPVVAGVLLPTEAFEGRLGPDWRDLVVGRRVRVRGRREDYHCDGREQCMRGGVIPLMTDIVEIALCRGSEPVATGKIELVSCPVSEAERAACLERCAEQSDACDRQAAAAPSSPKAARHRGRGGLRRCGCAKVSCDQGCERDGVALFACR